MKISPTAKKVLIASGMVVSAVATIAILYAIHQSKKKKEQKLLKELTDKKKDEVIKEKTTEQPKVKDADNLSITKSDSIKNNNEEQDIPIT